MKKLASFLIVLSILCTFAVMIDPPVAVAGVDDCLGLENYAEYYIKNEFSGMYLTAGTSASANVTASAFTGG